MSYKLISFDGTNLPTYNRESGLDTGPSQQGFVATVLGGFDVYGLGVAPVATPYPLTLRGIVSEETDAGQRAALDGLRAKARVRGKLVRQADDDDSEQWAWARLAVVAHRRVYNNRGYQILDFTWSMESEWYSDRNDVIATMDGSPYVLTVENAGNRTINDAILTITADDANLTAVTITATNTELVWTGTLLAGDSLVIDCGAKSIKNDGVNAYSGFSYGANHAIDDWLRIAGETEITITYTGGGTDPTVTLAFNDGWY